MEGNKMGEKIAETEIPREKGYLYFTKGDPLEIWKAKMSRSGKSSKKK